MTAGFVLLLVLRDRLEVFVARHWRGLATAAVVVFSGVPAVLLGPWVGLLTLAALVAGLGLGGRA